MVGMPGAVSPGQCPPQAGDEAPPCGTSPHRTPIPACPGHACTHPCPVALGWPVDTYGWDRLAKPPHLSSSSSSWDKSRPAIPPARTTSSDFSVLIAQVCWFISAFFKLYQEKKKNLYCGPVVRLATLGARTSCILAKCSFSAGKVCLHVTIGK